MQTTLASCPRNHRYLHPRFLGAGVFVCQVYKGGELTIEFDFEFALFGNKANFLNESASQ